MLGIGEVFDSAAPGYDRARRMLVPGFDGFYGAAVESIPFGADEPLRVLDLGAGTGLLSAMVAGRFPRSRVTLVDLSVEMLRVARRRFAGEPGRFEFRVLDHARKPLPGRPRAYDVVVSALSIHHLTHGDKRELFEKVHGALAGGGWFVNADQVLGPTPEAEREYGEDWLRRVRLAGASDGDLAAALARMKADKNATLEAQTTWLEEAGFAPVESFYEDGRFAVYGGLKGKRRKEETHG
ncbi:methyltransferase domain-containing protein [Rubrobacter marinus]|uniref:Methyltransferase domain-containing protein n=1 Tax=Rubrobacter marinus TaxID=2653852 RepID=A0A6G8PS30_9ACTN|nr:class I SAM-dependent methyltransferase [Rubrobacter marinus]QIN77298.1 methyltransferase domain-containing protein [Rubrobacter marinus]